ncbi:MAG: deoxynucleoside kinase [Bacteroidales bacterium]|jgi:deoxyadenosine/deoxycytidine kinase|nr:deoxynucleoside kinase [Bacteroidales bacterium]MDD2688273.1 deoxynucleoside kinase [Bacteroidales bacterium]MDD3691611.1 deoxynucleoside kinase [Bacteroidales bacterium]MDD4045024.1 deoxynucleoside kinase [Bacteroidales bacterium]MDD4582081.1 deoxynucleoside kinase [Bacteroidales bacterium]
MHIAVAGNIGSGKTTLTKLLAKHFAWIPQFEDVDTNPYLASFYEDMQRWSFNLQVFFLNERFRHIIDIRNKKRKTVIQDRTIYEDAYIFAPNLHEMGLMSNRDYTNYLSLFELINSFIQPPDLLIYLKADISTLVSQIQKRGRPYEDLIRLDYLKNLNDRYNAWAESYKQGKMLVIDVDTLKFSENQDHLGVIIEKINAELFGLFKEETKK